MQLTPISTTGLLIVIVFLVFVILWYVDRRDTRIARQDADRRLQERDDAVAAERVAMEARIAKQAAESWAERRKLDEEARAERRETQELLRQLSRASDAVQHAITGLEKVVDRLLAKD